MTNARTRARTDRAKEARRSAILETARQLFVRQALSEITMSGIAQRAGLAKGTLYLYFRTKEEIFLELLMRKLARWVEEIESALETVETTPEAIAQRIATSLASAPDFTALLGLLHLVLEQNLSEETALSFKRRLLEEMTRLGTLLEERLPRLGPGGGTRFLLRLHVVVVGLEQVANPSAVIAPLLERPELAPLRVDFETELTRLLTMLLRASLTNGSPEGTERRRR